MSLKNIGDKLAAISEGKVTRRTHGDHLVTEARHRDRVLYANSNISDLMAELGITTDDMLPQVEAAVANLLTTLGIDWQQDHNSEGTPHRLAKMYLRETMVGRYEEPPKITEFPNVSNTDQMIVCAGIRVESLCSHHHQNIRGYAYIGVLPDPQGNVLGLSKFSRIVRHLCRRPQIQEELTVQIATAVQDALSPLGVVVLIDSEHQCMSVRGVQEPHASTSSTHLLGEFLESTTLKDEFYKVVEHARNKNH